MLNTGKIGIFGLAAMSVAMTGCSSVDDDADVVSDRDYEYLKVIFCDMPLLRKCADNQCFTKIRFSLNIKKYP